MKFTAEKRNQYLCINNINQKAQNINSVLLLMVSFKKLIADYIDMEDSTCLAVIS